ncbi:hypothetical protein ACHAQA_006685 [Verticillium albo-atrum]
MVRQTRATARAGTAARSATKRQVPNPSTESPQAVKRLKTAAKAQLALAKVDDENATSSSEPSPEDENRKLSEKKWTKWSDNADSSPYPDFSHPTMEECQAAYDILEPMHGDKVRENFGEADGPSPDFNYPNAMDALVVAALSQATSWSNAKRAMNNMKLVYGSTFAYDAIVEGGIAKLTEALRPGGMQNRKSKILMGILKDVKARHGKWDLQHLFDKTDAEVVKEVVSYWGIGPKCAHCLLSICLHRNRFAVDTHIYRISGLWGWRPKESSVEKAQAHLNARIPDNIKFMLHYLLIVHGRDCPACRGNGTAKLETGCEAWKQLELS